MSDIIKEGEPEIQYILNDTEFILDHSDLNTEEMNDIIYTDGNQAIVLNGHIVQETGDTPTLVLQDGEDISQYLLNDDQGELLIADIQNTSIDDPQDNQIIQYIDEDGNITEPTDIVYVSEDGTPLDEQEFSSQYEIAELMEAAQNSYDNNDETDIDVESLINKRVDNSIIDINSTDWYQYAVSGDDDVHITVRDLLDSGQDDILTETNDAEQTVDISTITGKNLITGQVVNLENYMGRIKKRLKSIDTQSIGKIRPKRNLNAFINKKFNLGLTIGGKKLIGKIVHVGSQEKEPEEEREVETHDNEIENIIEPINADSTDSILDLTSEDSVKKEDQLRMKPKLYSKKSDQFQRISKTLSGLMNMDNMRKKVMEKSIQIEIIDRYVDKNEQSTKNVSFISGYMELKTVVNPNQEEWTFVPDTIRTENIRNNVEKRSKQKYPNVVNLTIITTYHSDNKHFVKVVVDSKNLQCRHCERIFSSNKNLIIHMNEVHKVCEVCNCVFEDTTVLKQHKLAHIKSGELLICTIGNCKRYFATEITLRQHLATHKLEPFKCQVCSYSAMSEEDLRLHLFTHPTSCRVCGDMYLNSKQLAEHKKIHEANAIRVRKEKRGTRTYSCDICKRTFSRRANLHRHVEIHKGPDNLYRCAVCGCSYHFLASLTRHVVQNHVQRNILVNEDVSGMDQND